MNERILELAIEARKYAETKPDIYQVAYDKKFAELIVLEAANLVEGFTCTQEMAEDHYEEIDAKDMILSALGNKNGTN